MAKAKETETPEQQYVVSKVNGALWGEFRAALLRRRWTVTQGLEQAIEEWLEANSN